MFSAECAAARRVSLVAALDRMGLSGAFKALVTSEDGMETKSQNLLSAAIKLGRPPSQCVAFESSPAGLTAAHNCTMKVGWQERTLPDVVALLGLDVSCLQIGAVVGHFQQLRCLLLEFMPARCGSQISLSGSYSPIPGCHVTPCARL